MNVEIELFQLREHEKLIGSGLMAFQRGRITGTIFVTNQRVCFHESLTNFVYMSLPLSEVAGYRIRRVLLLRFVSIYDKQQYAYTFSGFPAKKLPGWLEQAGVKDMDFWG